MRRRGLAVVAVLGLALAGGCGGAELTNEDVGALSDEDALAMLDCQMRKASEDLGPEEAATRYADELIGSAEEDGDTLQVILDRDGYGCPEFAS